MHESEEKYYSHFENRLMTFVSLMSDCVLSGARSFFTRIVNQAHMQETVATRTSERFVE